MSGESSMVILVRFLLPNINLELHVSLSLELADQNFIQIFLLHLEACPRVFSIHCEA
jgi:hypothetical protein